MKTVKRVFATTVVAIATASAAANAALGAIGDALDEAEAAERDVGSDGPVVYDAESKDVSEDGE